MEQLVEPRKLLRLCSLAVQVRPPECIGAGLLGSSLAVQFEAAGAGVGREGTGECGRLFGLRAGNSGAQAMQPGHAGHKWGRRWAAGDMDAGSAGVDGREPVCGACRRCIPAYLAVEVGRKGATS